MTAGASSGEEQAGAQILETHCAVVLLVGNRAYKMKKPVNLRFLNFSTREARERACREEVRLNQRMAPDVYLGVLDVLDPKGVPCEHVVAMKRMPESRRLSKLVQDGADVREPLRELAKQVAAFHARAETNDAIATAGSATQVRRRWRNNIDEVRALGVRSPAPDIVDRIDALAQRFIDGRAALFEDRIRDGMIRDGHGDLLADDVFCLADGPRAIDCLEFDDRLRWMDVLDDVACLAMDLERLGEPALGQLFLRSYEQFSGAAQPASLAHHYVAYRAFMRAKVSAIRGTDDGLGQKARDDTQRQADRLAAMALDHLERGRVRLVAVGGPPASGKSTVARGVAAATGAAVLSSDRVRKETLGLDPSAPAAAEFGEGAYTGEATRRTYEALATLAGTMLARGQSVVVDATCTTEAQRQVLREAAAWASADLDEVLCVADESLRRERLRRRSVRPDALSDADEKTGLLLAHALEPWPTATTVDTSLPAEGSVAHVVSRLSDQTP